MIQIIIFYMVTLLLQDLFIQCQIQMIKGIQILMISLLEANKLLVEHKEFMIFKNYQKMQFKKVLM